MASFFSSSRIGDVQTITLEKPKQHNVLNPDEMMALQAAIETLAEDRSVRVLILTGEGKSFCAGADLGELKDYNFGANPLENLTDAVENFPCPTICRLNGGVYGGGTDLALACDFRIGMAAMKCFIPPARIGIHYHPAGMARAVARLGLGPAKRLFLALDTMEGPELKEIGFLDYLVADGVELDQKVETLATQMTFLAPLSLSGMKATFNDIARQDFDEPATQKRQTACLESDDFEEGRTALSEKRSPQFTGS